MNDIDPRVDPDHLWFFIVRPGETDILFGVVAIALVLITCLSRVYLGVHDIQDVLAGVLVGIIILIGVYLWSRFASDWFSNRILGQKLLIALMIPFTLAAIYIVIMLLIGEPDYNVAWDASRIDLGDRAARDNNGGRPDYRYADRCRLSRVR